MLVFVSHIDNLEQAKKAVREMQAKDPANCYVCPVIAFSHLTKEDRHIEEELRLDLLTSCDRMVVASYIDKKMEGELRLANVIGMEVSIVED